MEYKPAPPKRTIDETNELFAASNSPFAWEVKTIGKRTVRCYRNTPPSLAQLWRTSAATFSNKEYIVYEGKRLSYADANERILRLASLFYENGVRKGDRVAIAMRNLPEWIITWWACHLLGGIAVAVNAWLPPAAFFHCISITEPKVVIVDEERQALLGPRAPELRQKGCQGIFSVRTKQRQDGVVPLDKALGQHQVRELPQVDLQPEDHATIFFTSGTTSLPKGVLSTQRQFLTNRFNTATGPARAMLRKGESLPVPDPNAPQRSVLLTTPLFHVMGNQSFLTLMTSTGGKLVLMYKFDAARAADLICREKLLSAGGVPNLVAQILDEIDRQGRWSEVVLEGISYGGGPPSSKLPAITKQRIPNAMAGQGYGLTEVNSVATTIVGDDYIQRPTSCGQAPPVVSLKIVDPDSKRPVSEQKAYPAGKIGEVCIFGPNVSEGYWRDEAATRKAFDEDGWFRSGDLGYLDEEGFLFIADRAKDIIVRSGENIASVMVEDALSHHAAVREAAVVPVPCEVHGEQVAAVVLTRPEHAAPSMKELQTHVASILPKHCVPALILFEKDDMPRNGTGKVLKNELKTSVLREWERRGLGRGAKGEGRAKL